MATPTNPVILSTDAYTFITSNNYPTMRTALGVGTTDSPTFSSINPSGNLTVRSNISLGYGTLTNTDTNLAIGNQPLHNLVTGSSSLVNALNTAVGFRSLNSLLSGGSNTAIGGRSLGGILSGTFNTAVGLNAGYFTSNSNIATVAENSVFIGTATRPLSSNQTDQIVIGREAVGLGSNTTVIGNSTTTETRLGGATNHAITTYGTYTNNTVFERLSLRYDTSGQSYIIGTQQGSAGGVARDLVFETNGLERARITAGGLFTAGGIAVGRGGSNRDTNTAVGSGALVNNFNYATDNTAIGYLALSANREGAFNTAIGSATLFKNTIGGDNTAVGSNNLYLNTTGSYNSVVGSNALYSNTTGNHNIAMGYSSLVSSVTGSNNVAIGSYAGDTILGGSPVTDLNNSILIGANTKPLSARGNTNSIVIGEGARGKGSNTVVLGNDSITNTYLKGDIGIGADTFLVRDGAANTLALRNSTNTQTLNLYSTYTNSGNYQRLRITPDSIVSEGLNGGAQGPISINGSFVYLLPGTPSLTTNRLVVASTGSVGIGISTGSGAGASPVVGTGKLNVNGDIESTNASGGIILTAAGTSTRYRITLNPTGNGFIFTPL